MRVGLIASTAGHLAVLLWGVVSFPDAKPFDIAPVDTLPVDLVPVSELTRLRIGEKTAEVREVEATRPTEKPVEEPKAEEKPAETEAKRPNQAAPEPTPAPTPEPTPAPEPPTPEPPAPQPEPPAPQPEPPAPRAEPEPAPAPTPEPEKKVAETPPPPTVRPRSKPTPPPQPRREPPRENFNPNEIAALLNKVEPAGGSSSNSTQPASLGSRRGQSGVTMSQSEIDALRGQISRCWNPPAGAAGAGDLTVKLKFSLTIAGEIDREPSVINSSSNPTFGIAAESARRAVLRCAPYSLPAAKYEAWREVEIEFDPRELLGG
ncbi:cell envelope biogenesis protein TolA [Stappia sp. 28M-7]|uniref:cell envelope biogenesis protein TolA n=1 Tax=Stappia sp. 28M-7 TaxID=2762596 RepID=UPI000E717E4E|nr:cell envelope biogenesis protein TolA [Stappia sp. 28M-7]MBC2861068.1 cell envelope biogenesis protein TolA [Stappia sp. 28M-7]